MIDNNDNPPAWDLRKTESAALGLPSITPEHPVVEGWEAWATLSAKPHNYRYCLGRRQLDPRVPDTTILWVMINPSTADGRSNDPTIRRLLGFTQREGHRTLEVVNLYAWRASRVEDMWAVYDKDIFGPMNDVHLVDAFARSQQVVFGCGSLEKHPPNRRDQVKLRLAAMATEALRYHAAIYALTVNQDGTPGHPLYVPGETPLTPWKIPRSWTQMGENQRP